MRNLDRKLWEQGCLKTYSEKILFPVYLIGSPSYLIPKQARLNALRTSYCFKYRKRF